MQLTSLNCLAPQISQDAYFLKSGKTTFGQKFTIVMEGAPLEAVASGKHKSGWTNNRLLLKVAVAANNSRVKNFSFKLTKNLSPIEAFGVLDKLCEILSRTTPAAYSFKVNNIQLRLKLKRGHIVLHPVHTDVLFYPDACLQPGDELYVQCQFMGVAYYHSGIYAGKGKVFHFLSEGNAGYCEGHIRLDTLESYVRSNLDDKAWKNPTIFKVGYPLRIKSPSDIVQSAVKLMCSGHKFVYHIRYNNCQHFSSACSISTPFSYDMSIRWKQRTLDIAFKHFVPRCPADIRDHFFSTYLQPYATLDAGGDATRLWWCD